jgi:hypothetical protein
MNSTNGIGRTGTVNGAQPEMKLMQTIPTAEETGQ